MARMYQLFGLAVLSITLTGCVTQGKYDTLKMERDRYIEQLANAASRLSAAEAEVAALKGQLAAISAGGDSSKAQLVNLMQQITELEKQIAEWRTRYQDALKNGGFVGGQLPPALTSELEKWAAANPDLVTFDAARGMVKFKSDLTFAMGSAELTPAAEAAIKRFAAILNSGAASSYELMVSGHTCNTPVSRPETKAKHPDNWYLSAHRAISVGHEMMSQGIASQRLGVQGFADQRPIASNASDSGKAQNRRVEVLILPTTIRGGTPSIARPTATPAARPVAPKGLDKDAGLNLNK